MNAARDKKHIACRLDDVVTLTKQDKVIQFVIWDRNTLCSGSKGIFPTWFRVPSVCRGPRECVLLKYGELLYPPDQTIWTPLLDEEDWPDIVTKFASLPRDSRCDPVRSHVEEVKRKWGIVR